MTNVGSVDVLEMVNIDEPKPASRQVKVRLLAAGVNRIDTKLRSRGLFFQAPFPPFWAATVRALP